MIYGHAGQKGAYAVSIRFQGRPAKRIVLTGGWFVYPVPPGHRASGAHPIVAIELLAQSSRRLGTFRDRLRLRARKPHFTNPFPSTVRLLSSQSFRTTAAR